MSLSEEEPPSGLTRYVIRRAGGSGARYIILVMSINLTIWGGAIAAGLAVSGRFSWGWGLWSIFSFAGAAAGLSMVRPAGNRFEMRVRPILRSSAVLPTMSFVLYLRSFKIDKELSASDPAVGPPLGQIFGLNATEIEQTKEEEIARFFRRFGRLVAVGHPGEEYPLPGITRFYLRKDDWKSDVSELIQRARLVLLVAAIEGNESAEGTLWEFTEAVRILPPSRLLLLVCTGPDAYHAFRDAAAAEFARRGEGLHQGGAASPRMPVLPDYPPFQRTQDLRRQHPLRGVIRFTEDWAPEFMLFDPTVEPGLTARRRWRVAIRTQVDPLMAHLEARLPGQAVKPDTFRRGFVMAWVAMIAASIPATIYALTAAHATATVRAAVIAYVTLGVVGGIRTTVSRERQRTWHDVTVLPAPEKNES